MTGLNLGTGTKGEDGHLTLTDGKYSGYTGELELVGNAFNGGIDNNASQLNDIISQMGADSSNTEVLAHFQQVWAQLSALRQAQSKSVQVLQSENKDTMQNTGA
jgi:hypothetical protein